jgi:hypothetical protein
MKPCWATYPIMKTRVHVLVPLTTPADALSDHVDRLLAPHRMNDDDPTSGGRFDYLCQLDATLNCTQTEYVLPHSVRRAFAGRISNTSRLSDDASAGALVTPDGNWHDISDFGWRMMADADSNAEAERQWDSRYRNLVAEHQDCWVVETYAHS